MSDEAKLCTVLAGLAAAAWVVVILFLVGASYSWTDERFQQRLGRVLEVMRRERIDFAAQAFITSDGRISTRVVPTEATDK